MPPKKGKARKSVALDTLPETEIDEQLLGNEGEEQAAQELGIELDKLQPASRAIARYLRIQRPIDWTDPENTPRVTTHKTRTAYILQRRGDEINPSCTRCRTAAKKPFKSCVAGPVVGTTSTAAFVRGACACCFFLGKDKDCSLVGNNMLLDGTSISQYVNDGFDLRDALEEIEEEAESQVIYEEEVQAKAPPVIQEPKAPKAKGKAPVTVSANSRPLQTVPSSTFFGAFHPDKAFFRVGLSRDGPRCQFDGDELRFPISRKIWDDPRRLLTAFSDLATFVSIVQARLYEVGQSETDSEYAFWRAEAARMSALYKPPQHAMDLIVNRTDAPPPVRASGKPPRMRLDANPYKSTLTRPAAAASSGTGKLAVPRVAASMSPMVPSHAATIQKYQPPNGLGITDDEIWAEQRDSFIASMTRRKPGETDKDKEKEKPRVANEQEIRYGEDDSPAASPASTAGRRRGFSEVFANDGDDQESASEEDEGGLSDPGMRTDTATRWAGSAGSEDDSDEDDDGDVDSTAAVKDDPKATSKPVSKAATIAASTSSRASKRRRTDSRE
ncbi:hypothetical protein BJY04DRAFT_221270 [Aspergillus karnatakaensis]|uniref:DUF3716 domain-containing protein n=1 Tax=Aspergillus karnatakaensis TaxID=1810916 RepID=UPI003CCE4ABF